MNEFVGTGKKKTKKKVASPDSHSDAVLGLSWNRLQRNALASASADTTVKLWDLESGKCVKTISHHKSKVQAVQWNPAEAPILISGGFDSKIHLTDVRAPDKSVWQSTLQADIETLQWLPAPHHNHILVSLEDGFVFCFDVLKGLSSPLWKLQAHDKPVNSLAVNPVIPGLIATGAASSESPLKIWDLLSGQPSCLYSKTSGLGEIYAMQFSTDSPFHLALGQQGERPVVLNTMDYPPIFRKYSSSFPQYHQTKVQFS